MLESCENRVFVAPVISSYTDWSNDRLQERVYYGANKLTIEAFKTSRRGIISAVIAVCYFLG